MTSSKITKYVQVTFSHFHTRWVTQPLFSRVVGKITADSRLHYTSWMIRVLFSSWCVCVHTQLLQSCLFATLWILAHQCPLSMGFSRQEHWSGLPCPPPGDRPNPGIETRSPVLQAYSLLLSHLGSPF